MSLQTRLASLITSIGADVKNLQDSIEPVPQLPATFSFDGILYVKTGTLKYPIIGGTYTIEEVAIMVGTAPTGASLIVDIKKNGTTIYSGGTGRPTITAGSTSGTDGTPSTTSVTTGDYLTADVAQVGSTVAGADLTVYVGLRRTA